MKVVKKEARNETPCTSWALMRIKSLWSFIFLLTACSSQPPTAIDLAQALTQTYSCPLLALSDVSLTSIEPASGQAHQVVFTY
ncbi:MAG: hypothetical protein JWL63_2009, partial [Rhodocyclales bacterium]|nr:hypothetical protein [Rhodocyclales bacterium]